MITHCLTPATLPCRMNFDYSPKTRENIAHLEGFMAEHIYPLEAEYRDFTEQHPWQVFPQMEGLKASARAAGLWNLFLPEDYGDLSPGLTNLEYAPPRRSDGQGALGQRGV